LLGSDKYDLRYFLSRNLNTIALLYSETNAFKKYISISQTIDAMISPEIEGKRIVATIKTMK
jgi:hypothetical protein